MRSIAIIFIRSIVFFSLLLLGYSYVFIGGDNLDPFKMVLVPSMTISTVLLLMHVIISKIAGVRDNFLSQQSLEINSNVSLEELAEKIKQQLKWRQVKKEGNNITFISPFSLLKSFGEKISISKENDKIIVSSKPLLITTIFDFGKNYQNLSLVKSLI